MNRASADTSSFLNRLIAVQDHLNRFGYALFLRTHAPTWSRCRGPLLSGTPYRVHEAGDVTTYDGALVLAVGLGRSRASEATYEFGVTVAWTAADWWLQAAIEDEDLSREQVTTVVWESSTYRASTLDEAQERLQALVTELTEQAQQEPMVSLLAAVADHD